MCKLLFNAHLTNLYHNILRLKSINLSSFYFLSMSFQKAFLKFNSCAVVVKVSVIESEICMRTHGTYNFQHIGIGFAPICPSQVSQLPLADFSETWKLAPMFSVLLFNLEFQKKLHTSLKVHERVQDQRVEGQFQKNGLDTAYGKLCYVQNQIQEFQVFMFQIQGLNCVIFSLNLSSLKIIRSPCFKKLSACRSQVRFQVSLPQFSGDGVSSSNGIWWALILSNMVKLHSDLNQCGHTICDLVKIYIFQLY
eukprot:TRINITY_DN23416_c0_g2_i2.p1 TRINITY_DN23416_c0_g2~~TRINITY_DN23416_c0_g2_i2.p1  ORF type:complete len:251 (-),score=-16.18 TRINITY_DN23416_c0_g2_i2:751-1503(-)